MNVIKEVHSVKPCTDECDEDYVEVDLTVSCYDCVERHVELFTTDEWEQAQVQGYYKEEDK